MAERIIIDCGATSAKLAVIGDEVKYYNLQGFNPHHHKWQRFQDNLISLFNTNNLTAKEIVYYGTGISTEEQTNRMKQTLSLAAGCDQDNISVFSDLLACAHAAYPGQPVIIGILGTGSNIGYYDGASLSRITPSLGYLLGDEGSGVDIGRALLKAHIYHQLPNMVSDFMSEHFNLDIRHILDEVYTNNALRPFLSQFAPIAHKYYDQPLVCELVNTSLRSFMTNRLKPEIEAHPDVHLVHLFGSVANAFHPTLKAEIKSAFDIEVRITKNPLDLLVEKHNV